MKTESGGEGGKWEIQGLPHVYNPLVHEHLRTFMWLMYIYRRLFIM